ncbi:myopalladin isoform X2 [Anguilla anguilla]|uniref:myopalladin isoform X2 n=1 Tax=Anguilla anguilla TaxID=7936 RepID=UPI0015A99518|nr:myopalladin isoform X2 [Anguilla anguilla]
MQENSLEPNTSLAQILRESYMVDSRAERRHGETGSVDASPQHLLYGTHRGKSEGSVGQEDLPDLSAFLSSEELHKSVNLARQAIGQGPQEERLGDGPHAQNPSPEKRRYPQSHPLSPDRQTQPSATKENRIKNNRNPTESHSDFQRPVRNTPYGPETQSKKEFLNKAADFIEELSSLFKANSSKRVRPRACKAHRSRSNVKTQSDSAVFAFNSEDRERPISLSPDQLIMETGDREGTTPPIGNQLDIQESCLEEEECGQEEEECGREEAEETELCDGGEVEECEAEGLDLTAVEQSAEPVPDPPRFIQKLKSREVPEGSKVQLDCIVRGFPVPEVRWFCEGKELENSPDIQILSVGELHSLIIAEAFEEDTGRYSCFASNFYGTDSTSAEIYIEGASSSDSDGEQHFVGVTQVPRKTSASFPVSPPSTIVENSLSAQPPVCLPVTQYPEQEAPTLLPLQVATTLSAQVSTPLPAQELSTPLSAEVVSSSPPAEVSPLLPAPVSTAEEVPTPIPVQVSTSLPAQITTVLPAEEVSPPLSIQVSTLLPVQEVSTPLPVQVSTPLTAQVTTQIPVQVSSSITAPVTTPIPVQVSPSLTAQVTQPIPVQVSPSLTAQVTTPIPVQVSPSLTAQVTTSTPVQVSPSLTAQVTTQIPVQVSPPITAQVTTPIPVQVSTPVTAQVTTPVTVQVSPSLTAQVTRQIPVQVSPPLTAQVTKPIPVQVSTPVTVQVTTPTPVKVSTPLPSEEVSTPPPIQLVTSQRPFLESENCGSYPHGLDGRPIMAAPVFTKSLQDVSALEGQLVVLECRVKGVPSPRVDWYREGTVIDDSPDFRILQKKPRSMAESEEICTLVIAEVFPEDSGTFTCTAVNKYGTVSSIAQLKVKAKASRTIDTKAASKGTAEFAKHKAPEPVSAVLTRPCLKPPEEAMSESHTFSAHPLSSILKPRVDPAPAVSNTLPPDPLCFKLQGSEVSDAEPCTRRMLPRDPPPSILKPKQDGFVAASDPPVPPGTLPNYAESWPGPPAPEPPASCLKPKLEGVLVNHNEPRSSSRVGLRVHFKLPEDEASEDSESHDALHKEPPPVLAKPKLDPVQLQLLHNQVLLEQQQESAPQSQQEPSPWPPSAYPEPQPTPNNLLNSTATALSQTVHTTSTNISQSYSSNSSSNNMAQNFSYTRPREFVAAQGLSPVSSLSESLSPTESPVPFLNAMAAQLPQRPVSSPPFSPTANQVTPHPPKLLPTRVLRSPTSPPVLVSSPPPMPHHLFGSGFSLRAQSPPQASSPTPSGSTPSPIQNPVAFLSSVLPSLPTSPPPQTNAMGLPRGAPVTPSQGAVKRFSRTHRSLSDEEIRDSKDNIVQDLERKLHFRDNSAQNGQQEYRVSNFEQRLMSEIEFRLERTPVEESDDEVQHDEIPTGKCIAPIFDKKLKNYRAMEGVPVTFSCKVVGIPVPKVYWFKDGKQILKKNTHYKKMREGDGTCALHIEATTNDDDGNYTVMAANPQGRISCSGHLIVQTGPIRSRLTPMIHSQRIRSRAQEAEEGEPIQERFFRPHFLQAPGDMLAHEGRVCRLDCKVSGLPSPDLMWLVNGKPILPDFCHRMLVRENGVHSLLIDPLKQSDAGTYTCIATNKAGQSSFCLELSVVAREVKRPPVFVEKLQNTGIAEGSPVRLECRVVGMPPPVIYWKKDNESIPLMKERLSMHQDATGYVCLLIQPTKKEDAAWYTVSAKNEAGIVSCTARLDIYAQWHQQIPLPMKTSRSAGSRYAALASQGLDVHSAFPTMENNPILFTSTPAEAAMESEEL